jgi:hypothetical protein
MKVLIVSLIIWIFLVPGALTIGLTLRFLADVGPPGVVLTWIAVACATAAIVWAGLWFPGSSRESIAWSTSARHTVPPAEKKNDSRLKVNRPASIH